MRGLKKVIQKKLFIYLGNMIELPPLLSMVFDNGNMILPGSDHVNRIFLFLCMFFALNMLFFGCQEADGRKY